MTRRLLPLVALALYAPSAQAHHGVAVIGTGEPEGPGVALETTAAIPLPRHTVFALVKSEFVSAGLRPDRAAFPEQKTFASFNTFVMGLGILPSLSMYLFQPVNVKGMDGGVGNNRGLGDTNLMAAFGFKWDEGLRLVPQKESLDELLDWHFLLWTACSFPTGATSAKDNRGDYFAPDMQTGFGAPSPAIGFSALKQVAANLTFLGEANHQRFFTHTYAFTRYQFGAETRLNLAGSYRLYAKGRTRVDLATELLGLHLGRDREQDDQDTMKSLSASGGAMLYGNLGVRLSVDRFAFALGARRALLKSLNEEPEQQGSEGLERVRLTFSASMFARPQN